MSGMSGTVSGFCAGPADESSIPGQVRAHSIAPIKKTVPFPAPLRKRRCRRWLASMKQVASRQPAAPHPHCCLLHRNHYPVRLLDAGCHAAMPGVSLDCSAGLERVGVLLIPRRPLPLQDTSCKLLCNKSLYSRGDRRLTFPNELVNSGLLRASLFGFFNPQRGWFRSNFQPWHGNAARSIGLGISVVHTKRPADRFARRDFQHLQPPQADIRRRVCRDRECRLEVLRLD